MPKKSKTKLMKTHVKRGDIVEVITGEDAGTGKSGKVLKVIPAEQRAIVEGLNLVKKTVRKTQDNPQGGITDVEAPIAISNLRLVGAGSSKS